MGGFLLAVPVLLPLAGGLAVLFDLFRHGERGNDRGFRVFLEGLVLVNSLVLAWLITHRRGEGLLLFRLFGNLVVGFQLDRMGSVFAGLIAFLWPLAMLYSFEYMEHEERKSAFFAFYIMTYGITAGITLSVNLVTMYVFYEMLTLVTFPLVLYPLTKEAVRAARRYLYYSIGGAAFAFIGLVFVLNFSVTGNSQFVPGGVIDPAVGGWIRNVLYLVYVLAFFGFGVKAALFPCHGWLPKAAVAPTPVTALLHAVAVVKSGAFAIMRLTYFSYGAAFLRGSWAHAVVLAAAAFTVAYGSTMAVREIHWKRRLAYSTIANLSYILFGAALMTPLGLAAALSHMVAHAFMKICAFFCAGAVMHRSGRTYVYELDGLGRKMPVTFACLTVASLSLMGIPLFAGFISKWNLAQAAFGGCMLLKEAGHKMAWLPCLGICVILYSALMTGIYMMTVLVRAYFPQIVPGSAAGGAGTLDGVTDPGWLMLFPLLVFAVVILALGLRPGPLMEILYAIGGEAG